MFRDFDPLAGAGDREVPDPYYGGDDGFDEVLAMVRAHRRRISVRPGCEGQRRRGADRR